MTSNSVDSLDKQLLGELLPPDLDINTSLATGVNAFLAYRQEAGLRATPKKTENIPGPLPEPEIDVSGLSWPEVVDAFATYYGDPLKRSTPIPAQLAARLAELHQYFRTSSDYPAVDVGVRALLLVMVEGVGPARHTRSTFAQVAMTLANVTTAVDIKVDADELFAKACETFWDFAASYEPETSPISTPPQADVAPISAVHVPTPDVRPNIPVEGTAINQNPPATEATPTGSTEVNSTPHDAIPGTSPTTTDTLPDTTSDQSDQPASTQDQETAEQHNPAPYEHPDTDLLAAYLSARGELTDQFADTLAELFDLWVESVAPADYQATLLRTIIFRTGKKQRRPNPASIPSIIRRHLPRDVSYEAALRTTLESFDGFLIRFGQEPFVAPTPTKLAQPSSSEVDTGQQDEVNRLASILGGSEINEQRLLAILRKAATLADQPSSTLLNRRLITPAVLAEVIARSDMPNKADTASALQDYLAGGEIEDEHEVAFHRVTAALAANIACVVGRTPVHTTPHHTSGHTSNAATVRSTPNSSASKGSTRAQKPGTQPGRAITAVTTTGSMHEQAPRDPSRKTSNEPESQPYEFFGASGKHLQRLVASGHLTEQDAQSIDALLFRFAGASRVKGIGNIFKKLLPDWRKVPGLRMGDAELLRAFFLSDNVPYSAISRYERQVREATAKAKADQGFVDTHRLLAEIIDKNLAPLFEIIATSRASTR